MADDSNTVFQGLIDRINQGDRTARQELLERACERLRRLAATVFVGSFPALHGRHEMDSVVHEAWLRLAQALDSCDPQNVEHFFRLAALKIRQVLLDMVQRQRRATREVQGLVSDSQGDAELPAGGQTHDPARLALWSEFHARVAALPDDVRAVFEMHYYLGMPQTEVAKILGLHPRKVSYLWLGATEELADGLEGTEGLL